MDILINLTHGLILKIWLIFNTKIVLKAELMLLENKNNILFIRK